jgi:hypothetical protein
MGYVLNVKFKEIFGDFEKWEHYKIN